MDSTSDSENKVGWGTTILSHIYGDTVYIVSDGRRCSSSTAQGILVTLGNDKKIYRINDKLCATTAGNVGLCEEMLEIARKEARDSEDMYKISTKLKKYKEKYLCNKTKEMERNKNMGRNKNRNKQSMKPDFKAELGLNSVDGRNRRPFVELIGCRDFDSYKDGAIVGSGTGGETAEIHFSNLLDQRKPRTPLERLSYMKRSVVASGLDDPYTGGLIQDAILSPNGLTIEVQNNHIIKHLADSHQHFVHMLVNKLLCITRHFAYNLDNEGMMAKLIKKNFSNVSKTLLLGVHEHLIVRILVFPDEAAAARAFDSFTRDHVSLRSGFHPVEISKPTRNDFIVLARDFNDEKDL